MKNQPSAIFPGIHFDLGCIWHTVNQKFSPNLYRFVKRHVETMKNNFPLEGFFSNIGSEYYLGYRFREVDGKKKSEEIMAVRAASVLVHGVKAQMSVYEQPLMNAPDFWETYLRLGRCIFDPEHTVPFLHAENRYTASKNRRVCNWCGFRQQRFIQRVVIEKVMWEPVKVRAAKDSTAKGAEDAKGEPLMDTDKH